MGVPFDVAHTAIGISEGEAEAELQSSDPGT